MNKPIATTQTVKRHSVLDCPITIVLPVYNGLPYLEKAIESVLAQTLPSFEFLILDDGSTDGSWDFLSRLNDERISLYRNNPNRGLFYNLNFLIGESSSPLIKLWSQDDIMEPTCLDEFVRFQETRPNTGFTYCRYLKIGERDELLQQEGQDLTPVLVSRDLHARIAYYTGSIAGNIANVCIRKSALEKVGQFNERMKISADFDMWVRLARHFDTGFINKPLIRLRAHDGQLSRQERFYINHVREDLEVYRYLDSYVADKLRKEGRTVMRQHKLVFYYTLMVKSFLKGKFRNGLEFGKELAAYDNLFALSLSFMKAKLKKPTSPGFLSS